MDLHHRIVRQARAGAFQIGQGAFAVAVQMLDPAIGIHEGRHIGILQPPRHDRGAGDRLGIVGLPGRQQAGQVVGRHDGIRILPVEPLVDGDGAVDIARAFQNARLGPQEVGIVGQGREAAIHHRAGGLGIALLADKPHQRQIGARILRIVGDQCVQPGTGGFGIARGGLGHGLDHAHAGIVRIGGHQFGGQFARGPRIARGQTRPQQAQLRPQPGIAVPGQPLEIGHGGLPAIGGGDPVQVQLVGGHAGLGAVDPAQLFDHAAGARQVGHFQIDPAQQGKQGQVLRIQLQRRQDRILGRAPATLIGQHLRQPQGLRRRIARGVGRLGQVIARQIGLAHAQIGIGHQPHRLGILGLLVQHVAQGQQRRVGLVGRDLPAGLQLQRVGMAGILGQDRIDLGFRGFHIAGLDQHPRQLRPDIAGPVAGLDTFQQRADLRDRRLALTGIEVEAGLQHTEDQRIAARRQGLVRLGPRGLFAALKLDEADQVGPRHRIAGRRRIGQPAQEILGPVGLVSRQVEADQIGLGLGIVGEILDRGAKLGLDARHVALFHQQRQLLAIAQTVVGLQFQQLPDQRPGPVHVIGPSGLIQRDAKQQHILRTILQQAVGLVGQGLAGGLVPGLVGLLVTHRQAEDTGIGIVGGQFDGAGRMAAEFIQVAALEGHPRQRDPGRQIVGILFGQAQILAVGAAGIALACQGFGQGLAGLVVIALDVEDVAELHDGAVQIACGHQVETGLVIFGRLLGGGFASGQRQGQAHRQGGGQDQAPRPAAGAVGTGKVFGNHEHLIVYGSPVFRAIRRPGAGWGASIAGAAQNDTDRPDQDPQIQAARQVALIGRIIAHAGREFRFISC